MNLEFFLQNICGPNKKQAIVIKTKTGKLKKYCIKAKTSSAARLAKVPGPNGACPTKPNVANI